VLTAAIVKELHILGKNAVYVLKAKQRFGVTSILNLQNRRNSALLDIGLFGIFFDLKNTGGMLFRNVGWLLTDYTALRPRIYFISDLKTVLKRRVRRKQFIS
jgi:hypothetical protein